MVKRKSWLGYLALTGLNQHGLGGDTMACGRSAKWFRILLLAAVLALSAQIPAQGGVIVNGGFETGTLSPWYQDGNYSPGEPEDWHVTAAAAHSGDYGATVVGNKGIRQDFGPVPAGSIVSLTYWILYPEGVPISVFNLLYSDLSKEERFVAGLGAGWNFIDATGYLDPSKSLVGLEIWGYAYGGPAEDRTFLDDVNITAGVPEPAGFATLATGLVALALRRRCSK
jgi:hypothetical protein